MLGVALRTTIGSAASYDAAAAAYFAAVAAAGGSLSASDKTNYNTLIAGLKTDGVWALLDYCFMAAPSQTAANIDLVGLVTGSGVNTPTWTNSQGYAGNGSNSYFNTNYKTTGSNFTQNSCHFSAYNRTSRTAIALTAIVGTNNNNGLLGENYLIPKYTATYCGLQDAGNSTNSISAPANAQGHWIVSRTNSTTVNVTVNGSTIGTLADNSVASINTVDPWLIDCLFQSGAANYLGTDQIASVTVGASLTAGQVTSLHNRIQTFFTAYGTQV